MSVDTRMDKEDVVYIYNRLDYYWAIKKNEIGSFEATWMDLENAILSEVTSQQRDTSYDIPYIRNLKEIMQMNLFTKQKETHRLRKWTYGCQGEAHLDACSVTLSCLTCDPKNCGLPGPLSMGLSQQEHCSGLPFPPPGHLLDPGIEPASLVSPELAGRFLPLSHLGSLYDPHSWM